MEVENKEVSEPSDKPSYFAKSMLGVEPYNYQSRFLDSEERFIVFRAGRKAGKTFCTAVKALHHAVMNPNSVVLLLAPTLRQSQILFWELDRHLLSSSLLSALVRRKTQTMMFFINGSSIHALPAGRTGYTVRGFTPNLIIVDESAYVPDDVLKAVLPSLLGQRGKIIMCSTPFGKRGYFYECCISGRWTEFFASSIDNPRVKEDPMFIDEVKRLTKEEYRQEVEAEFLEETDNFLPRDLILSCVSEEKPEVFEETYMGVDVARFGVDSTVYTLIGVNNRNVWVKDIVETIKMPTTDTIGRIKELNTQYLFNGIKIDETGLGGGVLDVLRATDLPVEGMTFTVKSKEDMYMNLKLMMEQGRLKFPNNQRLILQLADMKKQFGASGNMKIFSDSHEDYSDSLALACSFVRIIDRGRVDLLPNSELMFG